MTGAATALAVAAFRRQWQYRLAVVTGAAANTAFGLVRASILIGAVTAAGGTIGGYDAAEASTYTWVTQALIAPVYVFSWMDLALRVRTGDIAVDLARPVDVQVQFLAADLGRAAFVVLPRAAPPLIVGALTTGLSMPPAVWAYALGSLSVVMAVVISFSCRFAVNLIAFWIIDVRGLVTFYVLVSALLGGMSLPVAWFPPWLQTVAACTPFPSMIQAPATVLTGRVEGAAALRVLAVQAGWTVAVIALGAVMLRRGTRRLVVQGG